MSNTLENFLNNDDIIQQYIDATDIGLTIDNPSISDYIVKMKNNGKITLTILPSSNSSIRTVVFKRKIKWYVTQKLLLNIETDHAKYMDGYLKVEHIFKNFLQFYKDYSIKLNLNEDNIYIKTFTTTNLDMIPDLMFYIDSIFTKNVSHWIRFKRLFAMIDCYIDPVIIDTIKFKFIKYLLQQNRITLFNRINDKEYISVSTDPQTLHKLMNMLLYLPYCYLFFMFKIMNMDISFPSICEQSIPINQISS